MSGQDVQVLGTCLDTKRQQDGQLHVPGNHFQISKSLQNLQVECKESLSDGGVVNTKQLKVAKHRRTQSYSCNTTNTQKHGKVSNFYGGHSKRETENGETLTVQDQAVNIDEIFGGKDKTSQKQEFPPRLLVVSSKVRNISTIRHALLGNVISVQYNFETHTLEDLLNLIGETLAMRKVHSIALVFSCVGSAIQLCAKEERVLTKETIVEQQVIQEFFSSLSKYLDTSQPGSRIDFLACTAQQHGDARGLLEQLEDITAVPVAIFRDFSGGEHIQTKGDDGNKSNSLVGELYFRLEKLRGWSGHHQQTLAGFEKIRTVGKGAYGAAVLYKKKDDDSLVILKEINMHDLNAAERQLALNEVKVLAMLDHPNIISYYDSFEEDGVLMIEIEYADGGTLGQFLSQQEKCLEEKDVLAMFQQMVAAIRHIHEHNILHRDLKTDNIFLTKEGVVKVGDFGISKMMSSANNGALTVLGTPYYISPEMCEGKQYSFRSDIWALGCILYEMACLQKTFEGSNLPALVNKIMKGQFAPVKGNYSQELKDLVMDMLRKEPDERPSANEILYQRLPELMNRFEEPASDPEEELMASTENINRKIKIRSVLYYMESSTGLLTCFTELPPRMKIKQVAVGPDHVIVVTTERQVFSWGEGKKGQLGHGDMESKSKPELIDALKGKSISMACCGDGISMFGSDNGLVLTCGDGSTGCLGHDDWCSASRPRLIELLLSVDVVAIACGLCHVVAVGSEGEVFAWGQGTDGRLGLGNEECYCHPVEVLIEEPVIFRDVRCGVDGTMLLTDVGSVFACGSNENNKLGLNNRQGFLMAMKNIFTKTEVEGRNIPTPVRALARHRVIDIAMGPHHTAVIVEPGHVYTFGRNTEGQLGTGNTKTSNAPVEVKTLAGKAVNRIQCGEHYTVASTRDHELYYWGLRFKLPSQNTVDDSTSRSSTNGSVTNVSSILSKDDIRLESVTPQTTHKREGSHSRHPSTASVISLSAKESLTVGTGKDGVENGSPEGLNAKTIDDSGCSHVPSRQISCDSIQSSVATDSGMPASPIGDFNPGFRPLSSIPRRSTSASSRENVKEKEKEKEKESVKEDSVILFDPTEIIRIKQVNEKVLLGNFFCHGENLFVQVETTAPPPRRKALKKRSFRRRSNLPTAGGNSEQTAVSEQDAGDEYSSETSEIDSRGSVRTWLREELASCDEDQNDGNEADNTSDQSDDEMRCGVIDSSMSSIQINRELTPVKALSKISPRAKQMFRQQQSDTDEITPRNRTVSNNLDGNTKVSVCPESSSGEHTCSNKEGSSTQRDWNNTQGKLIVAIPRKLATTSKVKPGANQGQKPLIRIRAKGRGRGKSQDTSLKDQLTARGFVSDVTVKRREEVLLHELKQLKEEKRLAEAKLKEMEDQHRCRQDQVEQEAHKFRMEQEQTLAGEIVRLKTELDSQNAKLQDNQKLVLQLQKQLSEAQSAQRKTQSNRIESSGSRPVVRSSKVCVLQ